MNFFELPMKRHRLFNAKTELKLKHFVLKTIESRPGIHILSLSIQRVGEKYRITPRFFMNTLFFRVPDLLAHNAAQETVIKIGLL